MEEMNLKLSIKQREREKKGEKKKRKEKKEEDFHLVGNSSREMILGGFLKDLYKAH